MSSGKIFNNFYYGINSKLELNAKHHYIQERFVKNPLNLTVKLDNSNLKDILYRIIEIHFFLNKNSNLSNNQKIRYCKIERNLMIYYIKEIAKRL